LKPLEKVVHHVFLMDRGLRAQPLKKFKIMGGGKALDPKLKAKSKEMQALTAYLKTLAGKKTEAPKKKKVEGC